MMFPEGRSPNDCQYLEPVGWNTPSGVQDDVMQLDRALAPEGMYRVYLSG